MKTNINEIVETLQMGQEVTIILRNGEQMGGLYRGIDDEQLMLKAKNGNVPTLGWNLSDIKDIIITEDLEPAGDVVKVDISDVKTGRKVAITIDLSGEEGKCDVEFIPPAPADAKGHYLYIASQFIDLLSE